MVEEEVEEELLDFLGLLQLLAVVDAVDADDVLELPADDDDDAALVLLEPTRRSRDLLRIIGLALYGCR